MTRRQVRRVAFGAPGGLPRERSGSPDALHCHGNQDAARDGSSIRSPRSGPSARLADRRRRPTRAGGTAWPSFPGWAATAGGVAVLVQVPVIGEQVGREEPLGQVVVLAVVASHEASTPASSPSSSPHRVRRPPVPLDRRSRFSRSARGPSAVIRPTARRRPGVLDEDALAVLPRARGPRSGGPRQLVVGRSERPLLYASNNRRSS